MVWPPQSPDLNRIENLWDELERKLRGSSVLPFTLDDPGQKLLKRWTKLNVDTLQKLVESMTRRMESVIKAKGGPTQYILGIATFFWSIQCSANLFNSLCSAVQSSAV
jgi:hypothetical protein